MSIAVRITLAAGLMLASTAGFAAPVAAKTMTAQQQRMSDCSKQSAGKTGDARKAFMSRCLKGGNVATSRPTQQQKMTSCNADANKQALKGEARKAFMSHCLSG